MISFKNKINVIKKLLIVNMCMQINLTINMHMCIYVIDVNSENYKIKHLELKTWTNVMYIILSVINPEAQLSHPVY